MEYAVQISAEPSVAVPSVLGLRLKRGKLLDETSKPDSIPCAGFRSMKNGPLGRVADPLRGRPRSACRCVWGVAASPTALCGCAGEDDEHHADDLNA